MLCITGGPGSLPGKVKKRDILKVVHGDAMNRTSYLPSDTSDFLTLYRVHRS